jgi:hypothetical protein
MIKFEQPSNENPFGKIFAEIDNYNRELFQPPFTFQIVNDIDGEVKWESTGMLEGWWASYVEPCNSEAIIKDSKGDIVCSWKWDTNKHGDKSHKVFLEWCQKNKGSKGIAIGTHNGTTGEWVVPVFENLIEAYLVEASDKQYSELVNNYNSLSNAHTIQSLITSDGSEIEFFESEDGFTNSTSKEHVLKFNDDVKSVLKKSTSLNDLIIQCGLQNDLKWLHLEVEGIDDELIMSLDSTKVKLPEIIIYESSNLSDDRKKKVIKWLESKSYQCEESGWNTIAILNKLDLSLLVHTCDSYEKFWNGMFYTLDFYWDYDCIPVYFANEEKPMSDIIINCKETPYRPDTRIKQILTGKTDKNGFSTRFIEAVKQIPTKYVLYIQEDMWLKRKLDDGLLDDLIKFMDETNADSVRLHAKLWYYKSYLMEPTDYFVKGQRMLKNIGGDILSHNATIWRKDYILKHQLPDEDPWTNEKEGSKRMSLDNNSNNNYHYNIHWYCQPGIADKGEQSQESVVYGHIVDEMKSMELKLNLKNKKRG